MDGESAWGIKPGAASWAEDVENEEARIGGPLKDEEAFPSLGEAVKAGAGKGAKTSKKGKPLKMGLNDFLAAPSRRTAESDKELLMKLPKGSSGLPREERDPNALGGAFKDYGGERGGFRGGRERGEREEREPSRADASGDWGAERKFTPSTDSDRRGGGGFGGGFKDREGGFGGERRGGFGDRPPREEREASRADTAGDWGSERKFTPSADTDRRGGSFGGKEREGGGFRDRPRFEDGPSRADEGDWGSRRGPPPSGEQAGPSGRRGYGFSEQPVSQADVEDRWSHRAGAAAANGPSRDDPAAAPAERPRLKLQPRTKPLDNPPAPGSDAAEGASPHSEAGSSGSGHQQQPRKSNPFGAARPREEVLKEKGIDYQKEELKLEHGEVIRDKIPEEEEMEKEVEELRVKLEGLKELTPGETDTISELAAELDEKEKTLYKLQAELDDRVRFSKNRPERQDRERSTEPAPARGGSSTAAEGDTGFVEVRNPRRERSAAPPGQPEGAAPERAAGEGGAWGRGGSFKDRDGRGASFSRDRGGGHGGRDREGRDRERPAAGGPGRSGGGW